MEINANPSLNMYIDRELSNGDIERTLSDLDRYVKSHLVEDAIKIIKSKEPVEEYGCFEKILPTSEAVYDKYYIWEEARKIFE